MQNPPEDSRRVFAAIDHAEADPTLHSGVAPCIGNG
jgi:hypothetical protein